MDAAAILETGGIIPLVPCSFPSGVVPGCFEECNAGGDSDTVEGVGDMVGVLRVDLVPIFHTQWS